VTFGDLKEEGWEGKEWIYVAQDRNRCEHGNEPSVSMKELSKRTTNERTCNLELLYVLKIILYSSDLTISLLKFFFRKNIFCLCLSILSDINCADK